MSDKRDNGDGPPFVGDGQKSLGGAEGNAAQIPMFIIKFAGLCAESVRR